MTDERHTVSESADKITLKTRLKRGTGTRDEDTLTVKVKGADPETVTQKLDRTLANLDDTAGELRAVQPEGDA